MASNGLERSQRIAPGLYKIFRRGAFVGYRAIVWVVDPSRPRKGRPRHKRFKKTAAVSEMKNWRVDERRLWQLTPPAQLGAVETTTGFTADATTYLKAVKAMPSYRERKRDIDAWTAIFGERPRTTITSAEISASLSTWSQRYAASTVNHRRTALMHLWRVIDGPSAANPVKECRKLREPDPMPRGLSYDIVRRILAAVPPSKSRARLTVIAWTGIPHAQLQRIKPADVDRHTSIVVVTGRKKGGGTKARAHPLSREGLAAFKLLDRYKAWGKFSHSSLYKTFRLACRKVEKDAKKKKKRLSLAGVRPYDLRHSYGTALYAASGDIRATQVLMGHSRSSMTERYTLGAVDARVREAVGQFHDATLKPRRRMA